MNDKKETLEFKNIELYTQDDNLDYKMFQIHKKIMQSLSDDFYQNVVIKGLEFYKFQHLVLESLKMLEFYQIGKDEITKEDLDNFINKYKHNLDIEDDDDYLLFEEDK